LLRWTLIFLILFLIRLFLIKCLFH
jgi:uncharacterized membrane protein YtjA (UPF0391 family)